MPILRKIWIRRRPGQDPSAGLLVAGGMVLSCRLGRNGIAALKREGDGTTPAGEFPLLSGYRRRQAGVLPPTRLPLRQTGPWDGWCDAPSHPAYNRPVSLPFRASHEIMDREDGVYDVCLVMDYNITRRSRNRGSAVFFHLTGAKPFTQGCVAVDRKDMKRLLGRLSPATRIRIVV